MKYLMIGMMSALAISIQPALAESNGSAQAQDPKHKAETMHAPTNRVGEMVPTMSSSENEDDATLSNETNGNKPEKLHPPTNRVGDQVPTMTPPENNKGQ